MESWREEFYGTDFGQDYLMHLFGNHKRGRAKGSKTGQGKVYGYGSSTRHAEGQRQRSFEENIKGNGRGQEDKALIPSVNWIPYEGEKKPKKTTKSSADSASKSDSNAKNNSKITKNAEEMSEINVLNKRGDAASKGRGLFNEMGSSAKQVISGIDESKRLAAFGEPDLSRYSTQELKSMTERLNAETVYRQAAFPKESVKAKGAKAAVDVMTGMAGVAVAGLAAWTIVKKLKGDD